jgi:hypothetical protein
MKEQLNTSCSKVFFVIGKHKPDNNTKKRNIPTTNPFLKITKGHDTQYTEGYCQI